VALHKRKIGRFCVGAKVIHRSIKAKAYQVLVIAAPLSNQYSLRASTPLNDTTVFRCGSTLFSLGG